MEVLRPTSPLAQFHTMIEVRTLFCCIIFNMKPLSNTVSFNFVLKIMFDRDFIFKTMPKNKTKKCDHVAGTLIALSPFPDDSRSALVVGYNVGYNVPLMY